MRFHPPLRASPPFTPFHPFVNRVGVKGCVCIKSSMLGNDNYNGVEAAGPIEVAIGTVPLTASSTAQLTTDGTVTPSAVRIADASGTT